MNINKEYIDNLLSYGERISLECKKAEKDIPKSFWETYSSFANTIGGDIILGVYEDQSTEDNSQRFIVTGVTNVAKMKKTIFDTLNSNKVNKNIICDDDVHDIQYDEKHVLLVHVPQADYKQRPIFINGNVINGSFKRNFEGDYHCTEEEVKAMLRDSNDSGNDGIMIDNYNIDDIDAETLAAYRTRFRQNNPDHILNEKDDKEFLLNLGGYKRNRDTKRESLTLAGLLMFGKGLSIRERFDNIRLDYIDKTNIEGEITNSRTQRLLGINPIEAGKTLYRLTEIQMLVAEKTGRWTKYHVNTDYKEFCQVQNRQGQKSSRPNRQGQKEILINKIIKYCKVAKSLKEIALHVGYKDRFNLKRKYLNTLINEKKLGLTIPEKVDAKGQKYITLKEKSDNN